ncbi:MAG: glutathione synthase [Gammaproteobacteria bacterium]|nr:glutathione synthase [Gammaproteobacteria bacterium]
MSLRLGVLMDPIERINPKKDSTLAMLLAAQARGWSLHYMTTADIYTRDGQAHAQLATLRVFNDTKHWFEIEASTLTTADLDIVLMRVDPPFNMEYIYATYWLEQLAQNHGTLIVNNPAALRNFSEKYTISRFPDLCAPTLITNQRSRIREFLAEQQDIVVKPLDGMGGQSVFRLQNGDGNTGVILETLTQHDHVTIMAQRYLPAIKQGDKRVLVINGKPVEYALARIPSEGELRGNLAAGGRGEAQILTARDRVIAEEVGVFLKAEGILFAGLDIIGEYLTEINITSPTCIRELDAQCNLNIANDLLEIIEQQLLVKFKK